MASLALISPLTKTLWDHINLIKAAVVTQMDCKCRRQEEKKAETGGLFRKGCETETQTGTQTSMVAPAY